MDSSMGRKGWSETFPIARESRAGLRKPDFRSAPGRHALGQDGHQPN